MPCFILASSYFVKFCHSFIRNNCFLNPTLLCSTPIAKDCTATTKEATTSADEHEQQNSTSTAPFVTEKDVDIEEGGGDSEPSSRLTVKQLIQKKKMRRMQRVVRF